MTKKKNFFRFHLQHLNLASTFGDDWFAKLAEQFARFFGTPTFIIIQTVIVAAWIYSNSSGSATFDPFPFILLNLLFSTQAAYAAPMILLAQTRQADRDKAHAEADAKHREDLAEANEQRHDIALVHTLQMTKLVKENMELTRTVRVLSDRIERLIVEIHEHTVKDKEIF
jgi:uncharacterized membrane protein